MPFLFHNHFVLLATPSPHGVLARLLRNPAPTPPDRKRKKPSVHWNISDDGTRISRMPTGFSTPPKPTQNDLLMHGTKWYNPGSAVINIGDLNEKQWKVQNIFGEDIYPGSGHYMTQLSMLLLYGTSTILRQLCSIDPLSYCHDCFFYYISIHSL